MPEHKMEIWKCFETNRKQWKQEKEKRIKNNIHTCTSEWCREKQHIAWKVGEQITTNQLAMSSNDDVNET